MFKFKLLELVHWDYWSRAYVPMDGNIITIVGPNGSGKTTLIDACRTLLAINCSKDRNFQRYLRNAKARVGWLRAVVDNPHLRNRGRAFFPEMSDEITLVCRIRKSGGEWERKYAIVPGNVTIESIDSDSDIQWLGVRQYETRLAGAGITRAMRKVLALDQGETDKLCEYSGRDLLRLVFDTFGDQAVMNEYHNARKDYEDAAKELEATKIQVAHEEINVGRLKQQLEAYREWQKRKQHVLTLESVVLPVASISEAVDAWRRERDNRRRHWRNILNLRQSQRRLTIETEELAKVVASATATRTELEDRFASVSKALGEAIGEAHGLEKVLKQRDELQQVAAAQEGGFDTTRTAKELGKLREKYAEHRVELNDTESRLKTLNAHREKLSNRGGRVHWDDVEAFQTILQNAGIRHGILSDRLSVNDPDWQPAVEGLLGARRAIVLLDDHLDTQRAFELGQVHRYRHFITTDVTDSLSPREGTLAEKVDLTGPMPEWIFQLLNNVHCVRTIDEGLRHTHDDDIVSWITPDGFHRERRGGRHVGVKPRDFLLGETARQKRLALIDAEIQESQSHHSTLSEAMESLASRIRVLQRLLDGRQAAQELATRAGEFAEAEVKAAESSELINNLNQEHEKLRERKDEAISRENDASTRLRDRDTELRAKNTLEKQALSDWRSAKEQSVERKEELRSLLKGAPPTWRSPEDRTAILTQHDYLEAHASAIRKEIEREKDTLQDSAAEQDDTIELRYERAEQELQQQQDSLQQREQMRIRTLELVDAQRERYINVLKSSAGAYMKNVKLLAEMAGIEVLTKPLHIENTDISIAQAALEISFRFDDKQQFDVEAGDSSGGQKVMKSMILLIGLLMDEDRPSGMVFIDEPFAHLDIFNIDRVSSFLQKTEAQYLLTTPVTHNSNIYTPSHITVITRKVQPGQIHAPPIGSAVRRKSGSEATQDA